MLNFISNSVLKKIILVACSLVIFIFIAQQIKNLKQLSSNDNPCLSEYNLCSITEVTKKFKNIF